MHEPPYRIKNMMPGMIMLWHGAIDNIPSGWHLCDGAAGTVDLRNKFIPCAGDIYDPLDAGGLDTHEHDFFGDGHTHTIAAGTGIAAGTDLKATTELGWPAGLTQAGESRPQYKALCYIQKL